MLKITSEIIESRDDEYIVLLPPRFAFIYGLEYRCYLRPSHIHTDDNGEEYLTGSYIRHGVDFFKFEPMRCCGVNHPSESISADELQKMYDFFGVITLPEPWPES